MNPLRRGNILTLIAVLTFTTGCPYVGQNTYNEQLCQVDEDGDGDPGLECNDNSVAGGVSDCDDHDPSIYHGAPEIPYDGIDQDCDNYDLVDDDHDGYPGISMADFEALGTDVLWPENVEQQVDCDDTNDDIHPGASDYWYDGIDTDCGNDDDFDADGDGFASELFAKLYTGDLPTSDCDDLDEFSNPDILAEEDIFYDGVDADCSGNNDFDADGDGYIPSVETVHATNPELNYGEVTEAEWAGAIAEYMARYGYTFEEHDEVDCCDVSNPLDGHAVCDNVSDAGLTAADVHPTAIDAHYDAVDADCAQDNDFDADGDGFMDGDEPGYGADFKTFLANWPGTYNEEWGDCDDSDAEINFDATERISDAVDQDCDGGSDLAPIQFSDFNWENPRNVVIGSTNHYFIMVTGADYMDDPYDDAPENTWVSLTNSGISLFFEPESGRYATPEQIQSWVGGDAASEALDETIDAAFADQAYYAAATSTSGSASTINLRTVEYDKVSGEYESSPLVSAYQDGLSAPNDIDVEVDPLGSVWAFACANDGYHLLQAEGDGSEWVVDSGAQDGDACFVEPNADGASATATMCSDGATPCQSYDAIPASQQFTSAASQPYSGFRSAQLKNNQGVLAIAKNSGGATIRYEGASMSLSNYDYTSIDAMVSSDNTLYVAVVTTDQSGDGVDDVILMYGTFGDSLTEVVMPFNQVQDGYTDTHTPTSAAIYATDERVMVAISGNMSFGSSGVVGWVFYEYPP